MKYPPKKEIFVAFLLALIVELIVFIIWSFSENIQYILFSFLGNVSQPAVEIQLVFLTCLAFLFGYLAEKQLVQKYVWQIGISLFLWFLAKIVLSQFGYGVMFLPGIITIALTIAVIHIKKLWQIDSALTDKLDEIITSNRLISGKSGDLRLESGLQLLETLLPSSEVIVFEFTSSKELKPIGRMRSEKELSLHRKGIPNGATTFKSVNGRCSHRKPLFRLMKITRVPRRLHFHWFTMMFWSGFAG